MKKQEFADNPESTSILPETNGRQSADPASNPTETMSFSPGKSITLESEACRWTCRGHAWQTIAAHGLLLVAAICFMAIRHDYTPQIPAGSYERVFDFTAAVPFGKRVLMPLLAHVVTWSGIEVVHAFQFLEIISILLLCKGLEMIFRLYLSPRPAFLLGAGIFTVLPWMFLAARHEIVNGTLLFPWDLPAMAFTAWGIWAILANRGILLCAMMVFASLNRESAVLLPLLWLMVSFGRRTWGKTIGIAVALCVIYLVCQVAIQTTLSDNISYYDLHGGMSFQSREGFNRFASNGYWLKEMPRRPFVWLGLVAGLPLGFAVGFRHWPSHFRDCGLVACIYMGMLALVGNIHEPRIFGEVSVLFYVPVALGLWEFATGTPVWGNFVLDANPSPPPKWLTVLKVIGVAGFDCAMVAVGWWLARGGHIGG